MSSLEVKVSLCFRVKFSALIDTNLPSHNSQILTVSTK